MSIYGIAATGLRFAGPALPQVGTAILVLDLLDTLTGLQKIATNLQILARRGEDRIGEDIVRLARERGPDDTFRLERGTTWRRVDDMIEVVASAAREVGVDYAWFVERGTENAEAQPFFWDSAREVLARYGRDMQAEVDAMADAFNGG
jgi:hypothetical protein